jgi:hypothetical protein
MLMSLENRGLSLKSSTDFRKLLPKYVLGELSPEEIAEIDEKYLFDDSFADALEDARRDLLDSLAAGELSANERTRVEKALAQIPQYEGAIRVARALHTKQEKSWPANRQVRDGIRRPYWIWAAAAIVLCLVTLGILVKRQSNIVSPQTPQTSGSMPAPSTVSSTEQDRPQNELAFVVLLSPEVSRDVEAPSSLAIPANARFVEFQIVFGVSSGSRFASSRQVFSSHLYRNDGSASFSLVRDIAHAFSTTLAGYLVLVQNANYDFVHRVPEGFQSDTSIVPASR